MSTRFWSLALKELRLIRRDKRLALSLISRPTYPARRFAISSRTIGTSSTGTSMAVWVVAS